MIEEYESKKYDFASRDIKAIIFDVIAKEEERISRLEEKIAREANEETRRSLEIILEKEEAGKKDVLKNVNTLLGSIRNLEKMDEMLRNLGESIDLEERPLEIPEKEENQVTDEEPQQEETKVEEKESVVLSIPGSTTEQESEESPIIPPAPPTYDVAITFQKRTNEASKVIMTSRDQTAKLRASLPNQEALLNARGFFQAPNGIATSFENTTVMIPADATQTQVQVENLINQANQLYAAGNIEGAQQIYDQISQMSKQMQEESVGITR